MLKSIFNTTVLALTLVALTLTGCHFSITGFTYTGVTSEKSEEGAIGESITRVEISNEYGDVIISEGTQQPQWTWKGTTWAGTQELADSFLSELEMDVQTNGTVQTWTVILPDRYSKQLKGIRSDLQIALPTGVAITLHNRHGNVSTSNIESDVDLTNEHGDLRAGQFLNGIFNVSHGKAEIQSGQSAIVRSSHGGATVRQIAGNVDVECHHGGLWIEDVGGEAKINSHHGGITANDLRGNSNVEAHHGGATITTAGKETVIDSAHGAVTLVSLTDSFNKIDVANRHGSIKLTLPKSTTAAIHMDVNHGNTSSEIATDDNSSRQVNLSNSHGNIKISASNAIQAEATE